MKRSLFIGSLSAALAGAPLRAVAVTPESRSAKIAMMAVVAGMIELPPAWICEIIFAAELASEALCDPARCRLVQAYQAPAVPAWSGGLAKIDRKSFAAIFSGALDDTGVALYQRAVDAQTVVGADEIAVFETVNRRFTARARRDEVAYARQNAYFTSLVRRTAADKRRANAAWTAFSVYAKEANLVDKRRVSPDVALTEIRATGFSSPKRAAMRRIGMSEADVELVRTLIVQTGHVAAPETFVSAIPTMIGLNDQNGDMAACSCRPY